MKSQFFIALSFTSFLGLSILGACDANDNESKAEEPQEIVAAAVDQASVDQRKTGHEIGDEGHAPLGSVLSPNGVFLANVSWSANLVAGSLENQATVKFFEPHLHKAPAILKSFKLFMPAMGHGSIKTDQMVFTQDPADPSTWTVSKIYFSMPGGSGEWVVDIEAELAGKTDKVRISIPAEVKE